MVQVDSRVGSRELYDYFPSNTAELTQLDAGDFSFLGYVGDEPVLIGVERMTLRDFVNKVWSGRLYGHQIPKMLASYAHSYAIIEGTYRHSRGYVSVSGKRLKGGSEKDVTYQQLECMLLTLIHTTPIRLLQTNDEQDTVCTILALEYWWRDASLHTSHRKIYAPPPVVGGRQFYAAKLIHQIARQLPGIGDSKILQAASHFGSVKKMINATKDEWYEIEGVGKTTAARIVKAVEEMA